MSLYEHWTIACRPGGLDRLTAHCLGPQRAAIESTGGRVLGVFKPLIGMSLNHAVVIAAWPGDASGLASPAVGLAGCPDVELEEHGLWEPTLRPAPSASLPDRPGLFTHRWYDIDAAAFEEFRRLSGEAWGNFETAHEAQVIGLWRERNAPAPGRIRMRLMAWYRDMGVWERSRYFNAAPGAAVANERLGARYAMTLDSCVAILQRVT